MEILELPQAHPAPSRVGFDFASLSNVLFESADMLEESSDSDDAEFRSAAVELAIRSLYTASAAIDRYVATQNAASNPARTIRGPWVKGKATATSN